MEAEAIVAKMRDEWGVRRHAGRCTPRVARRALRRSISKGASRFRRPPGMQMPARFFPRCTITFMILTRRVWMMGWSRKPQSSRLARRAPPRRPAGTRFFQIRKPRDAKPRVGQDRQAGVPHDEVSSTLRRCSARPLRDRLRPESDESVADAGASPRGCPRLSEVEPPDREGRSTCSLRRRRKRL